MLTKLVLCEFRPLGLNPYRLPKSIVVFLKRKGGIANWISKQQSTHKKMKVISNNSTACNFKAMHEPIYYS